MPAIALHVLLRQSVVLVLCARHRLLLCILLSATPFLRHSVRQDSLLHMSCLSGLTHLVLTINVKHSGKTALPRQQTASAASRTITVVHLSHPSPSCLRYRSTGLAPICSTRSPPQSTLSANGSLPHATLTKASSCTCMHTANARPAGCRQ
jgi:hypothetical protein